MKDQDKVRWGSFGSLPPRAFHASLACHAPSGRFVQAWNAGAYPAEDFIRDRADPVGHFISPDRFPSLLSDERDDLPDLYRCEVGDIHHDHIHAHQPDDRGAASLNQDRSTMGEPPAIAVG